MEDLGQRPVWSMSGSEMLSTLDVLDAELARLQTYRLQVIAGLEDVGYAQEVGAHDTARLLTFRYRLNSTDAHRDVRLARALPKYDAVAAALPDPALADTAPGAQTAAATAEHEQQHDHDAEPDHGGEHDAEHDRGEHDGEHADHREDDQRWLLRPAQAEAIVSALERVPATVPVEDVEVAEQQLVNLARHLSPAELRRAGKQIRDLLDTDGPEPDEHKAYARESLTLSDADNGVAFRGYLANENAELLRALIHANARPHKTVDGDPDPRPRAKRQADALTTTLTLAATATDTTPRRDDRAATERRSAGVGTALASDGTTLSDRDCPAAEPTGSPAAEHLTGAEGGRSGQSGWVPGFGAKANITVTIDLNDLKAATAEATGQLVYGDNLSAAAIRRLACDANIIPLVLGTNSEPLDIGRAARLVNRHLRRALNARDKGCVVCAAPPIHCDAHHLHSWLDGGPTAINNLVLLCRRHHRDLHSGHWTIHITNGTVHVTRPAWADPPPPHTLNRTTNPPPPRPARSHPPLPDDAPKDTQASPRSVPPASEPAASAPAASAPAASAPAASAPATAGPNSTACEPSARAASGTDSAYSAVAPSGSEGSGSPPAASAHSACAAPDSAHSACAPPDSAHSACAPPASAASSSAASASAPPGAAPSAWAASPPEPGNSPDASGRSTPPPRRPSRWVADDEKLRQAAQFAVWSSERTGEPPTLTASSFSADSADRSAAHPPARSTTSWASTDEVGAISGEDDQRVAFLGSPPRSVNSARLGDRDVPRRECVEMVRDG
ncbi:DUF222 domain-containing protein [Kribbella sp. CA-247076]|uniref:DUF222 domain-containing protein n=1 Tax=Kribbella sp. CA-247076 TaxID=3239941 RepID=UPI003D8C0436